MAILNKVFLFLMVEDFSSSFFKNFDHSKKIEVKAFFRANLRSLLETIQIILNYFLKYLSNYQAQVKQMLKNSIFVS